MAQTPTGLHGTSWPWTSVPTFVSGVDAIETYMRRLIGTAMGERKMDNGFGSQVHAVVFANEGAAFETLARREIVIAVARHLPMVKVLKVDLEYPESDNEATVITVKYEYLGETGTMKEILK